MPQPGDPIIIRHQLYDGATNKYIRTRAFDGTGSEISGSPVALTHLALGLYQNNGGLHMPSSPVVFLQSIVYTDSGFTTQDPNEGIGTDCLSSYGIADAAAMGDRLFPWLQAVNGETDLFVRAHLYDATGTELAGSPVSLNHVANGLYVNSGSLAMPNTPMVTVQLKTYQDSGYTIPATVDSDGIDLVYLSTGGGGGTVVNNNLNGGVIASNQNLSGILVG